MDDDLNTADGITAVFELVRDINTALLDENNTKGSLKLLQDVFNELTGVLGIIYEKEEAIPQEILELVQKRKEARKNKDFALADKLRDEIAAKGYVVEETRQGTNVKKASSHLNKETVNSFTPQKTNIDLITEKVYNISN